MAFSLQLISLVYMKMGGAPTCEMARRTEDLEQAGMPQSSKPRKTDEKSMIHTEISIMFQARAR
jgi:hypothetical protein